MPTKKTMTTTTTTTTARESIWTRVQKFVSACFTANAGIYAKLLSVTGTVSVQGCLEYLERRISKIPGPYLKDGIDGITDISFDGDRFYWKVGEASFDAFFFDQCLWKSGYFHPKGVDDDNTWEDLTEIEKQMKQDRETLANRAFVVNKLLPAIEKIERKVARDRDELVDRICRDDILPVGC